MNFNQYDGTFFIYSSANPD